MHPKTLLDGLVICNRRAKEAYSAKSHIAHTHNTVPAVTWGSGVCGPCNTGPSRVHNQLEHHRK